jgi:hypothetical protein
MACVQLLPLCSVPRIASREGDTGQYAYGNFVGLGIYFFSGQTFSNPTSSAAQDQSRTYIGTVKPNTFRKGFACAVPSACSS